MVLSDDERSAFLLVLEERLEDFDSQGGNHISVYLVTHFELSDQSYKDVLSFNDDLLGMKHNCSYAMDILSVKEEFDFDFPFNMLAIKSYVQELIKRLGIDITLPEMKERDFDKLSQD
ncbi:hypothetical protein MOC25_05730 [Bacillus subtilis]|uniref:hypothetical protein n=1 Tax=Bacillus subtilis TaxID=1423 RepID=UPI00228604A1|nr:hypothetical protein [Bacillus subtilis]MCY8199193.1 hypothetical protein [Bacillus subtilis]